MPVVVCYCMLQYYVAQAPYVLVPHTYRIYVCVSVASLPLFHPPMKLLQFDYYLLLLLLLSRSYPPLPPPKVGRRSKRPFRIRFGSVVAVGRRLQLPERERRWEMLSLPRAFTNRERKRGKSTGKLGMESNTLTAT